MLDMEGIRMAGIEAVYDAVGDQPMRVEYDGFHIWHALLVDPRIDNEVRALKCLFKVGIVAYRPVYFKKVRTRGSRHAHLERAVMPGMLFVPSVFMALAGRDRMLELCHVHGYLKTAGGEVASLPKAFIEEVRLMEARAALQTQVGGAKHGFKLGNEVTFTSQLYKAYLGTATVIGLEGQDRIVVEVSQLFGRIQRVVVPAVEIEAM